MARSNLLATDKFLGSLCPLSLVPWVGRGTFAPLASKGGGQGPPGCGAKHKMLFCCKPQGEEEEEGRGMGMDPGCPGGLAHS